MPADLRLVLALALLVGLCGAILIHQFITWKDAP